MRRFSAGVWSHAPQRLDFRSSAIWATLLAIFFTVPPTVFTNAFVPLYLKEVQHLSQSEIARVYWQPFLATDAGQILGGLVVYYLLRRGWTFLIARRVVMIFGFSAAAVMLGINFAPKLWQALACLDLSRFFFQIGCTVLVAYGIESVAEHQTALMAGMMNATFSACNFVFAPLIGKMADHFGGYRQVILMIALSPILGLILWINLSSAHARRISRATPPLSPE